MQNNKGKAVKVLQIAGGFRKNVNGKPVSGGVTAFLNNYYMKMDHEKFQFDFLALRNQAFENYRQGFEAKGSTLYTLDIQSDGFKRFFTTIYKLRKFLKENHYDAVHINMGAFFPVLTCAIAAKLAGVKNIIAHSHSSGINSKKKRLMIDLFSPLLTLFADQYCACSLVAAENIYSRGIINKKKYKIIRNAIDVKTFSFHPKEREHLRRELGLEGHFVIGHVGRFVSVKNHEFLIDFFYEYSKKDQNARLLLVGSGELKNKMEEKVQNLGIQDKVIFVGQQRDVSRYYQGMDLFVMPSYIEGFPIVAMEAQSTGLPSYVSSNVTEEAAVTDLCKFFHLKNGPKDLAERVFEDKDSWKPRSDASDQIIKAGYDIDSNLKTFESLYT